MTRYSLFIASALTSAFLFTQAYADTTDETSKSGELPKAEIEGIIKDYIMKHPEVMQESFNKMQQRDQAKRMETMKKGAVKYKDELLGGENTPSAGDASTATVTITEFYDFHCGYCKQMVPTITKVLDEDKHVRVVFKDLPILSPDSELAAKASIAFYSLNKAHYFEFYTELMKATGHFDEQLLQETAAKFGVKGDALKDAMNLPEVAEAVAKNKELAKNLSVTGTPALFIGTEVMGGAASYDQLKNAIQKIREKKASGHNS